MAVTNEIGSMLHRLQTTAAWVAILIAVFFLLQREKTQALRDRIDTLEDKITALETVADKEYHELEVRVRHMENRYMRSLRDAD